MPPKIASLLHCSSMSPSEIRLIPAESDAELLSLFPLIQQLRPHLKDPQAFLAAVAKQRDENYRVIGAWQDGEVRGYAGVRIAHNLLYGQFLYVDDLVTAADVRGAGVGSALMKGLKAVARNNHCGRLVLDTNIGNALAQRFYFRHGLLARGMHFSMEVPLEG